MAQLFRSIRGRKGAPYLKAGLEEAREAINSEMKDAVLDVLEEATSGWKHKVRWNIRFYPNSDPIKLTINPVDDEAGKIFIYWEKGTRPHTIRARNRQALRFEAGGDIVFAKSVQHPGTKANEVFASQVKDWQDDFRRIIENAFRRAANQ